MRFGYVRGGIRRPSAPIFDPATQSWDALFLAPYAASPWAGTASLGTSGSRSLAEATNPPTAGTPVNGKAPSTYNGTNQKLTDAANISTYITTTEGTATACFLAAGITGGASAGYDNPGLLVDLAGGNFGLHVGGATNDKAIAYLYDSIIGAKKVELAISLSTWTYLQFRWKASTSTCEARLNGGSWTSLSGAAMTSINGTLAALAAVGRDYSQVKFFNGSILALACSKTLMTDGELDYFRNYLNATYPGISV